jgi:hypothetical protein
MLRTSTRRSSFRAIAVSLTALAFGAGSATSQQIFQVSPGGTYPTVQAAINAANHGDIVRIAAGTYPEFTCTKGVRIEGAPTVFVDCTPTGGIAISGVPAGAQCVLSGITMRRQPSLCQPGDPDPALSIRNSAGTVLVERVVAAVLGSGIGARLIVENVAGGVVIHDSAFHNPRIVGAAVHLTRVEVRLSWCGANASEVLYLDGAEVVWVDGVLEAGWPYVTTGCRLLNSRLTLGVAQGLAITTYEPTTIPIFVMDANSRVVQHSRVTPINPNYSGGLWLRNDEPVALRVFRAPPGGVVAMGLYVYGPAVPAVVFYGTQAPPSTLPFIDGPLALGSTGLLISLPALVTPDWSTTPAALAFGVPFVPALQGLPLAAQGFVYGGSVAPFRATNAVGFTLQ